MIDASQDRDTPLEEPRPAGGGNDDVAPRAAGSPRGDVPSPLFPEPAAQGEVDWWTRATRVASNPVLIWTAFIAVHLWLAVIGLGWTSGASYGDVELYRFWIQSGLDRGQWPVLTPGGPYAQWVYPVLALVPMLLAATITYTDSFGYQLSWIILVGILDAVAISFLLKLRHGVLATWWWFAFAVALGPVWMGRLDAIGAAIALLALAVAATRPRVAAVLITIGAWIKVAPGVLIIPLFAGVKARVRKVIVPAALTCLVVVVGVALLGGLSDILGFLAAQDGRGLQVEAVPATPYVIARLFGAQGITVAYDNVLFTYQVLAPGTDVVGTIVNVLLYVVVAGLALLLWIGRKKGPEALAWGALALTTALIVFNKVGSPQYEIWLIAPIAVALATRPMTRRWVAAAGIGLVIAGLTQWIYPFDYSAFLSGEPLAVLVETTRNVLLVVLFGLSLWSLIREVFARNDSLAGNDQTIDTAVPQAG